MAPYRREILRLIPNLGQRSIYLVPNKNHICRDVNVSGKKRGGRGGSYSVSRDGAMLWLLQSVILSILSFLENSPGDYLGA